MSTQDWPDGKRPVESSDGRNANPPVQGFFQAFTSNALGELKLWIEQEFDLRVGGGAGIQFNSGTYGSLNVGDWLSVDTSGTGTSGWGQYFLDTGGAGIRVEGQGGSPLSLLTDSGSIDIFATNPGYLNLDGRQIHVGEDTQTQSVNLGMSTASVNVTSAVTDIRATNNIDLKANGTGAVINVILDAGTGSQLNVKDASGNHLFEVRKDGSIHGKTTIGSITWDL